MLFSTVRIGSLLGFPIRIAWSWLLIFVLVLIDFGEQLFPNECPGASSEKIWSLAAVTTVIYFLSLLAHELGHALAARSRGIHVRSVELFIFGGIARMVGYSRRPDDEFVISAAGPLVTLILTILFGMLALYFTMILPAGSAPYCVAKYSCIFNAILLFFNLIPGYPLDGGRIAQAILWQLTGRRGLAAGFVTGIGYCLAVALAALGIYELVAQPVHWSLASGLLGIALAVFLFWTARSNYRAARMLERVALMVAVQALDEKIRTLPAALPVAQVRETAFADEAVPVAIVLDADGRATAAVANDGSAWPPTSASVADIALPLAENLRVPQNAPLLDVLFHLASAPNAWLVVENEAGLYLGTLTQTSLRVAFDRH
jgi:Zn-dependent protease